MKTYRCNNKEVQTIYGLVECGRIWNDTDWNKDVDTEYTRNEKCPKCGCKDIKLIN